MDMTKELWLDRVDAFDMNLKILDNLRLALTYGMMVDLGLREAKYDKEG
jgi:hypothetical protein